MSIDISQVTDAANRIPDNLTNGQAIPVIQLAQSAVSKANDAASGGFFGSNLPGQTSRDNLMSDLRRLSELAYSGSADDTFSDVPTLQKDLIQSYIELDAATGGRQEMNTYRDQIGSDIVNNADNLAQNVGDTVKNAAGGVGFGIGFAIVLLAVGFYFVRKA